jgi:hypothetical protein
MLNKHNDYIAGPHSGRLHFVFGFVFGAGATAGLLYWYCDVERPVLILAVAACAGLGSGFLCAKYGDRAWRRVSDWIRIWWCLL